MNLKEEIIDILKDVYYNNDQTDPFQPNEDSDRILKLIEIRINEKIQHVNEVLNDSRLTIQGCNKLKGKKEAFQEMKEMLNK